MNLILLILNGCRYAINMRDVLKVINTEHKKPASGTFLLNPDRSKTGIILKNNLIVPADNLEEIVTYQGKITQPGSFVKKCIQNNYIEGFIIVNNRIYSLLNDFFLKLEGLRR